MMKNWCILLSCLILCVFSSTNSFAAGLFTPMEPGLKGFPGHRIKGRVDRDPVGAVFGLGYFSSSIKVDSVSDDQSEPKLKQEQVYAHLGYNFSDDFEGYLRLGSSDMKIADVESAENFFATIGAGLTMYNDGFFSFGPVFQYSNYFNHTFKANGQVVAKIDGLWDLNLGMAFKVAPKEWLTVQVVPIVYWVRGDIKDPDGSEVMASLKEKNNYGGALTFRFTPLGGPFSADLEGQYKGDFSFGASLNYNF